MSPKKIMIFSTVIFIAFMLMMLLDSGIYDLWIGTILVVATIWLTALCLDEKYSEINSMKEHYKTHWHAERALEILEEGTGIQGKYEIVHCKNGGYCFKIRKDR